MGFRIWGSNLGKQVGTIMRVLHKEYKMHAELGCPACKFFERWSSSC